MKRKELLRLWPGPWAKWARNFCDRNGWRVRCTLGEYNDCMAECELIYVDCKRRYAAKVETNAQFMRLFQRCVNSWFNDWSTYDSKLRAVNQSMDTVPTVDEDGESECATHSTLVDLPAVLENLTSSCSEEACQVLNVMFNAPSEMLRALPNASGMAFLRSIGKSLGLSKDKTQDVVNELRAVFGASKE